MNNYSMDKLFFILMRKLYSKVLGTYQLPLLKREMIPNQASDIIYNQLTSNDPCMISRFGAVEISAVTNYLGTISTKHKVWNYITGKDPEWWWNEGVKRVMTDNAGFFPSTEENLNKFSRLMLDDIKLLDVLGSWQNDEMRFIDKFPSASILYFVLLDPYWSTTPWTRALKGKKVLVVHAFAEEIEYQYRVNRTKIFTNQDILPLFELKTLKAVQSIGGTDKFNTWFDALQHMKDEIDKIDYDICLIGCGAYGLPLAAHVKRKGKKAVHIGGTLQLLFGIKGKRWENPEYARSYFGESGKYLQLINDHWIRPGSSSQIEGAKKVEDSCYW